LWTAEQNVIVAKRAIGERGKLLVFEREAELRRRFFRCLFRL